MESNIFEKPISAEHEIRSIMQEVYALGANDYEMGALKEILDAYHRRELADGEAIAAARQVRDGKQDYH